MSRPLTWTTTEDIAIALADKFPDTDPLTIRFTDLHKWVTALEGFSDDHFDAARYTAQAISGSPISTGFVGGPSACSAAGLPKRRPVARMSQKLPPTKSPWPGL